MRTRYYLRQKEDGKWGLVEAGALQEAGPRLHIMKDRMDPLEHPCDGRTYDSKSEFRKVTRAHGCVEVGHEKQVERSFEPKNITADVLKAWDKLGYN